MKLLILTQKVDINDDVLGFFHAWIKEFSKYCESLIVVCLQKGEYDLPPNVKVLSLGKEDRKSRIIYMFRFYKHIWRERKNYDSVFVHMNQEYVLLGGLFWQAFNKKIGFWYTHKKVSLILRLAEKLANVIFTASIQSFRLASKKVVVLGHGIDASIFKPNQRERISDIFKIVTVGRISPVKDYSTLIKAAEVLHEEGLKFNIDIIGGAGMPEHEAYFEVIKKIVEEKKLGGVINFLGPIPNNKIVNYLQTTDIFVNMSHTGSLDKAILEAMACGRIVLTCNEAFAGILDDYRDILLYPKKDFNALAERIRLIYDLKSEEREEMQEKLRKIVKDGHNLELLIKKIVEYL